MPRYWILNDDPLHTVRRAANVGEWGQWLQRAQDRLCIAHDVTTSGLSVVTTAFNGISFSDDPACLFTTTLYTDGTVRQYFETNHDGAIIYHNNLLAVMEAQESILISSGRWA